MALKSKSGTTKGSFNRSKSLLSTSTSKAAKRKKPSSTPTTQHKPKPTSTATKKKKPPHLRYTDKELGVPQLNGIRPTGVQKLPNKKKGKQFVEDGEGMRTILAMVMAEKEGNIESKMMRARQLEEIREAKRAEAEKRAEGKRAMLEEKKKEIKGGKRKKNIGIANIDSEANVVRTTKKSKRVSFG